MELAFWFFDPPPIFRVLNSFFYIPWAHGTTRYMCQNGCFGGVFLVCQVMLTIEWEQRFGRHLPEGGPKPLAEGAPKARAGGAPPPPSARGISL